MTLLQPKTRPEAGGSFLFQPLGRRSIFTVEQLSDEQRLMYQTARDFTVREVLPHVTELESKSSDRMVRLLKQAGALGLLANDVPEAYGGLGGDKVTSMLLAEAVSLNASWSATVMAHNGIGTLPIVYFGSDAQKQKYLPRLASAEWVGAYALTEPGSGSDALAAKCRATLSADGKHYLLSGTKQFITNGAWADLYVVFAQLEVDGAKKFTAFLVERGFAGVSVGPEEHKLGLHGSSTCALILDNAQVPVENVLGEIGRGHKIAFNILNIGRWKLGAGSLGGAKQLLGDATAYAGERKQFGKAIVELGAIRKKLARAAAAIYATESMCYRVAGLTDERIAGVEIGDVAYDRKVIDAIEEYSLEASIIKVAGSEMLGQVADELLQVWGGYGFLEEYPPARYYRDNRINRIFEGTNEVNRLLVPGTLIKRAMAGQLPLMTVVRRRQRGARAGTARRLGRGRLGQARDRLRARRRARPLDAGAQRRAGGAGGAGRRHHRLLRHRLGVRARATVGPAAAAGVGPSLRRRDAAAHFRVAAAGAGARRRRARGHARALSPSSARVRRHRAERRDRAASGGSRRLFHLDPR